MPRETQADLDLQAYHRIRSRLVSRRTKTINQIRAFLVEQGIAVRPGASALRKSLFEILEHREAEISPRTAEIEKIAATEADCRPLISVPGVGPIISTTLVTSYRLDGR